MKSKVCIVDDHAVVRKGLKALINSFPNTHCEWELPDGASLISLIESGTIPDIIILDISMPLLSGWQTVEQLKSFNVQQKIIILTYNGYNENKDCFINSGVAAFLNKDASVQEIQDTIEDVILLQDTATFTPKTEPLSPKISSRELEFLRLICDEEEFTYEQIAEIMGVHVRTVDSFRKSLFQKLQKRSKSGLVLYAIKNGLLNQ